MASGERLNGSLEPNDLRLCAIGNEREGEANELQVLSAVKCRVNDLSYVTFTLFRTNAPLAFCACGTGWREKADSTPFSSDFDAMILLKSSPHRGSHVTA